MAESVPDLRPGPSSGRNETLSSDATDQDPFSERVVLNVGGTRFETYRSTLTAFPETLLGAMFSERNSSLRRGGKNNEYFFDRDPTCFQAILNFYRTRKIFLPPNVNPYLAREEFAYFQIPTVLTHRSLHSHSHVPMRLGVHVDEHEGTESVWLSAAYGFESDKSVESAAMTQVYTWGRGEYGQLGHGDRSSVRLPQLVEMLSKEIVIQISLGTSHSACLTRNGAVYTWGYGGDGRLGHGEEVDQLTPKLLQALKGLTVNMVVCGELHTAALASSPTSGEDHHRPGSLYTWGLGKDGRLGHGNRQSYFLPHKVEHLSDFVITQVACGGLHTAALTDAGHVYTFGLGKNGRLGHGDENDQLLPKLLYLENVKQVVCGGHHTAALDDKGRVYTWGFDDDGRLGHSETGHRFSPAAVRSLFNLKISQIACGCWHSAALTSCGSVYTWGSCKSGQLGQAHKSSVPIPRVAFQKPGGIAKIACGTAHTAALCKDGSLYTWGKHEDGRLGYNVSSDQTTPKLVRHAIEDLHVVDVVCGVYNSAAITVEPQ